MSRKIASNKIQVKNLKKMEVRLRDDLKIEPLGSVSISAEDWKKILEENKYILKAVKMKHLVARQGKK